MQQVSCTKTTRYKLRELNQFHDEKTQHAPRFTNIKSRCNKFCEQKSARTNFHDKNQARNKFHE